MTDGAFACFNSLGSCFDKKKYAITRYFITLKVNNEKKVLIVVKWLKYCRYDSINKVL